MEKLRKPLFIIKNLIQNSISHIETDPTIPAGQAPRGVYFDIEHYEDVCWYVKNHYSGPELLFGSSTITETDKFGELLSKTEIDHLVFRIKRSSISKHFVALSFNLKLHLYFPDSEIIAVRDISKNVGTRYEIQCVDLSENGNNIFYSRSNSIQRLDRNLQTTADWKIPNQINRQEKAASPERQKALSILGLAKSSSIDDIKSAFRECILKVHPDINPGDPFASEKTRTVIEAYEILTRGVEYQPKEDYKQIFEFVQIDLGFEGDFVLATQVKIGTDILYVGCYSGRVYELHPNKKCTLIYDCHAPVRKIKELGKYLYIISDQFWDISLDGVSVNRISGNYRFDRLLLEKRCNAEIINHKRVRLYSPGGIAFGEVEFRDNIADAFLVDQKLRVITGKKSYMFKIQPPIDYKAIADNNLILPDYV